VELLARSGVGRLVLVDPDRVEKKNINRILNTCVADGSVGKFKVDVLAEAIARMGFGTVVEAIPQNLLTTTAVERVAECDLLFGCVDGAEGRFVANRLASFYSFPYIDVGVRLDADGCGGITHICGTVAIVIPFQSPRSGFDNDLQEHDFRGWILAGRRQANFGILVPARPAHAASARASNSLASIPSSELKSRSCPSDISSRRYPSRAR